MERQHLLAVGDGGNDFQMIKNAGIGVAMGNAVSEVLWVADKVVPTNDDGGVATAIRYVLDAMN